jgi:membrane fusion protein (multidrug efflux system)
MSTTPPTPPQPPSAGAPPAPVAPPTGAPTPAAATEEKSLSLAERFRELSTATKVMIAVVIVALLFAIYIYTGRVTTDDAQVDAHISAIAPQVPGYAIQLFINDNVPVKEGEDLVEIDPRPYEAELAQAQANLDVAIAQANSAELQIGLTRATTTHATSGASGQQQSDTAIYASSQAQLEQTATANLQFAEANVASKRATNERAQSDLKRYQPLLGTDDVSKFQFDAVEAAARVAKSDLEAAEQQLAAAKQAVAIARSNAQSAQARMSQSQAMYLETKAREQQVPIAEATYKSAVANVERAKAAVKQAQLNLGYTHIIAPITGQLTQKSVDLGQYLSAGQLLFTIVPLDKVFITANFKETQLANVHPGQHANIHVDTYNKDFDGVVDSIAGATGSLQALLPPQNATGNFIKVVQRIPVKILVKQSDDPNYTLRPGMNVEATIFTRWSHEKRSDAK